MTEVNVKSRSKEYQAVFQDEVRKFFRKLGKAAAQDAKARAPKDTGELADSIQSKFTDKEDYFEVEVGARRKGHGNLAHLYEFGYVHPKAGPQAPQPFVGPATRDFDTALEQGMKSISNQLDQKFKDKE